MMDTLQKNSRSVLILHCEIKNCIVYFPRLPSLSNRMHNCWLWSSARSSVGGYLQWSIASKNWRRLADAREARGVIGRILAITQTCLITSFLFRICGVKTFITKSVGSECRSYNTRNHMSLYSIHLGPGRRFILSIAAFSLSPKAELLGWLISWAFQMADKLSFCCGL